MKVMIKPDCFVGDPMDFLNWRLLLARAAGLGVVGWEHDEITYLLPALDYETLTVENSLGIWDIDPEDVLIVLLAHSDEEGAIYPMHLGALADRLDALIPELVNFSSHDDGSPQQLAEVLTTERFVAGLRQALANDLAVTFHSDDMGG